MVRRKAGVGGADGIVEVPGGKLRVDPDDLLAVADRLWYPQEDPVHLVWWASKESRGGKDLSVYLGRFVLGLHGIALTEKQAVLHVNGDRGDARLNNLRVLNLGTANHRRTVPKRGGDSESRFIGVSQIVRKGEPTGRWFAKISDDWNTIRLGTYDTEEDAALAYDRAAKMMHGEWANLNYPEEVL